MQQQHLIVYIIKNNKKPKQHQKKKLNDYDQNILHKPGCGQNINIKISGMIRKKTLQYYTNIDYHIIMFQHRKMLSLNIYSIYT